jgi:hypothetical protein
MNKTKDLILFFLKDKQRMFIISAFFVSLCFYQHIPVHQANSLEYHDIIQIILNSLSLAFLVTTNFLFVLWLIHEILFVFKMNKITMKENNKQIHKKQLIPEQDTLDYNSMTNTILIPEIIEQKKEKV